MNAGLLGQQLQNHVTQPVEIKFLLDIINGFFVSCWKDLENVAPRSSHLIKIIYGKARNMGLTGWRCINDIT